MNRHNAWDLAQMQSLPLEQKIVMSEQRIRQWYEHYEGEVYVSFSGGKDSTVLLHLVRSLYPNVEAVFCDTGLEYPEIKEFVKTFENVTIIRPKKSFRQVIQEYGYPIATKELARKIKYARLGSGWAMKYIDGTAVDSEGRPSRYRVSDRWKCLLDAPFLVSNECCDVMKKAPMKNFRKESGKCPFIGSLASESKLREQSWVKNGCNSFEGKSPSSKPLSFWTEQDILEYLVKYHVPYCSVYGDIIGKNKTTGVVHSTDELQALYCFGDEIILPKLTLETTKCDRTGCMFCMFGCHLEKEPNRFQRMKETHPQIYEYCMKPIEEGGLGLAKVLDYINVKY